MDNYCSEKKFGVLRQSAFLSPPDTVFPSYEPLKERFPTPPGALDDELSSEYTISEVYDQRWAPHHLQAPPGLKHNLQPIYGNRELWYPHKHPRQPLCYFNKGLNEGGLDDYYMCFNKNDVIWADMIFSN